MFKFLFTLFLIILATLSVFQMIDSTGTMTIIWLGYEVKTGILTAFFFMSFVVGIMSLIIFLITKLFSVRLPKLWRKKKEENKAL